MPEAGGLTGVLKMTETIEKSDPGRTKTMRRERSDPSRGKAIRRRRAVTAVITTHNRQTDMVRRALLSVLAQTYLLEQIIIVDDSDAGFPGSIEIRDMAAAVSGGRVEYIRHPVCKGLAAARNTGLAHASGEFIAYLDDDDEWLPEKTRYQIRIFEKEEREHRPAPCLVYGGGLIRNDQRGTESGMRCRFERGNVYQKLLWGNWIGYPSFVMFRKQCLQEIGGFNEKISFMEDHDLYLRLARNYPVTYVKRPLAIYHEHDNGQMTDDLFKYIKGMNAFLAGFDKDLAADQNLYQKQWMKLAYAYAEVPDRVNARQAWRTSFAGSGSRSMTRLLKKICLEKQLLAGSICQKWRRGSKENK